MEKATFEVLWRLTREPNCPGSMDTESRNGEGGIVGRDWKFTFAAAAINKTNELAEALKDVGDWEGWTEVSCSKSNGKWTVSVTAYVRDIGALTPGQYLALFTDEAEVYPCQCCGQPVELNKHNWDKNHCAGCLRDAAIARAEEERCDA